MLSSLVVFLQSRLWQLSTFNPGMLTVFCSQSRCIVTRGHVLSKLCNSEHERIIPVHCSRLTPWQEEFIKSLVYRAHFYANHEGRVLVQYGDMGPSSVPEHYSSLTYSYSYSKDSLSL